MKPKIGYKFITSDWKSKEGNIQWKLGEWQKHTGKIKLCEYGFHACKTPLQALEYIYGDVFVMVEYRGTMFQKPKDKFVCSEMRVIREIPIIILKRFAITQARSCLANYEKEYPQDKRIADCIQAAEDYLDGKITLEQLSAAESAAGSAWSAARSAWSAARSAWSAAESARSAWSAAGSARSAAWSAARSAWSAAGSAWSAARSAWSAADKLLTKMIRDYFKKEETEK